MVCQFKDETHATKKSLTLASLYSCMASSAGVFSGPLYSGTISKRLSTSKISDCFRTENDFFREWMNANLLNGVDSSGTVSLTKLEEVDEEQFQYHLKITINNYQGDMWFVLTKPMSSFLLSHSAPSGQSLFGMTAHYSADVQHVRYDVMDLFENVEYVDGSYKVLTDIRRTRSVAQIDVSSSIPIVIDSDFWSLESDTTNLIKFYSVSGGDAYGLVGSSASLALGASTTFTSLPPTCMNQSECIERGEKTVLRDDLANLGTLENFSEQFDKSIQTPMPIVFNQAHLKSSPIEPSNKWSFLSGSIAAIERSFSKGKLVGDYFYLSGGETYKDNEFIQEEDPFRINLMNYSIQKINSDDEEGVFGTTTTETTTKAGKLENEHVTFIFGGLFDNVPLGTGAYIKKSTAETIEINAAWFEEKGFTVFPRYSPIVAWTGRYILIYGGLSLTEDLRVTSVNDGFVIDIETGDAWKMNADFSPSWATDGVWSGEYLISWGGYKVNYSTFYPEVSGLNTGAVYDPSTNSWSKIIDAPIEARLGHNLFWYEDKMIVLGGQQYLTNRDEVGPSYAKNAGSFSLGAVSKIYFTEERPRSLKENMIITGNDTGDFYLEGDFGDEVLLSVYPNAECDSTLSGFLPNVQMYHIARGKKKVTLPLAVGTNIFSVELESSEGKVCTNALTFIRN